MEITQCPCCGTNYPGEFMSKYIMTQGMCTLCDEEMEGNTWEEDEVYELDDEEE